MLLNTELGWVVQLSVIPGATAEADWTPMPTKEVIANDKASATRIRLGARSGKVATPGSMVRPVSQPRAN